MNNLISGGNPLEHTEIGISSLIDTWLEVRVIESNGERNRILQIIKSRGMEHSNQVREFLLTGQGVELVDVYLGQDKVLTGTARAIQELADKQASLRRQQQVANRRRELEQQRQVIQAQIATLQMQMEAEKAELERLNQEESLDRDGFLQDQKKIAQLRQAD
jgi:circadian clock protein KaiC